MDKSTNEFVIQIENLKKSFESNHVLVNINLNIRKGENVVVLGKSGSGKSVLIKCLVGLIIPDKGQITIIDKDIALLNNKELNVMRKKMGFLFQSGALYDSMTVKENLAFPLRDLKDLTKENRTALIEEALENVGLTDVINKTPSELSGGMRKRLGLARTLILKPDIMLYDEPTTGLDPITSKEISLLILEVQKKYQTSSIIITHDMACAKIIANRIVVFKDGNIAAEGIYKNLEKSEDSSISSFFE